MLPRFLTFCLAITPIVLAWILTLLVQAIRERQSFLLLITGALVSAWYGGRWPGLVATILAGIAHTGFLLLHAGPQGLGPTAWVELGDFMLVALVINKLAAERRRSGTLQRSRDALEKRVEERTGELLQANKSLQAGEETRKHAEGALSQLAAIEASTDDAVLAIQLEGTILSCNPAAEKLYNSTTEELVGQSMTVLLPREASSMLPHMLERLSRGETITQFESVRARMNGPPVHLLQTLSPIKNANGNVQGVCVLARDITQRNLAKDEIKLYQRQLRRLALALSSTAQRERRHIATELHDHLAQMLIISRMKIRMLQSTLTSEDTHNQLEEVRSLLDESIDYTRTLIWDLYPPMLHEVGLEAALEWLADQIEARHGIRVSFEDDEQPKASDENVRILLFQAVHELLMNVVKHAEASRAIVGVRRREEQVEIRVEDDGVGFDTENVRARGGQDGGFGLFSIQERLYVIGGTIEMNSYPGRGSRAILRAPLHPGS